MLNYDPWSKFEGLEKHFNERKIVSEQLIGILQEKIQYDEAYAKNMNYIVAKMNLLVESTVLSSAIQSYTSYITLQAEQIQGLSISMSDDVIPTIQENIKQISEKFKEQMIKAKKLDKNLKKEMNRMDSLRLKFSKTFKDTEEAVYTNDLFQSNKEINFDKKLKYADRMYQVLKDSSEIKNNFMREVHGYNQNLDVYLERYDNHMLEFKKLEEFRLSGLHDTYMKILVYEISSLRNLQYDIDRISKRVNLIEYNEDLEQFQKTKLNKALVKKLDFDQLQKHISSSIEENRKNNAKESVETLANSVKLWIDNFYNFKEIPRSSTTINKKNVVVDIEKSIKVEKFINLLTIGDNMTDQEWENFKTYIKDSYLRGFCTNFLSQMKIKQQCVLSASAQNNFSKFFQFSFDELHQDKDYFHAMKFLLLSEDFYVKIDKESIEKVRIDESLRKSQFEANSIQTQHNQNEVQKRYLYENQKNHKLFKQIKFWEYFIFEAITQAFQVKAKENYPTIQQGVVSRNIDQIDQLLNYKNVIITEAEKLMKRLIFYDIDKKDAIDLISRACKAHGIDDQTIKRFKEELDKYLKDQFIEEFVEEMETKFKEVGNNKKRQIFSDFDGSRSNISFQSKSESLLDAEDDSIIETHYSEPILNFVSDSKKYEETKENLQNQNIIQNNNFNIQQNLQNSDNQEAPKRKASIKKEDLLSIF